MSDDMSHMKHDSDQPLKERGNNRSRRVDNPHFLDYIGSNWLPRRCSPLEPSKASPFLPKRYRELGKEFMGQRLVIPAGGYKVRSNDTDYRFRAHSAFAYLTGLGCEQEPDAVLVCEPLTTKDGTPLDSSSLSSATSTKNEVNEQVDEQTDKQAHEQLHQQAEKSSLPDQPRKTHEGVLYFKPRAPRGSQEFYADSRYGEFWVGPRPSLEEMSTYTGLRCADIDGLEDRLAKNVGENEVELRVVRNVDSHIESMVSTIRQQAGLSHKDARSGDERLEEVLSSIRLCKDSYEIDQLRQAIDVTKTGFEKMIAAFDRAQHHARGERVLEAEFLSTARADGNGVGYETIVGSGNHACTLHWITNDGPVENNDLVLIDAGVELDSLYTADITRTLPVSGRFSRQQRKVYQAVLDACEAGLAQANKPHCRFRDVHDAAVAVLVAYLDEWGILPVSQEEALSPTGQQHRRWMPHGVSHHLGIDVHDCAQACRELYLDAELEPGMCFTIEPGLYFHQDDAMVPPELRGMGIRIEDDIVITDTHAAIRLSEDIPRKIDDVEAWMARIRSSQSSSSTQA